MVVKLVTFLKGNHRLGRSAFFWRWHEQHAPMAAKFPGLRGYVLSREVSADAAADAFAELWFDDRQAVQSAYSSEVGRSGSSDANMYTSRRLQALLDERWLTEVEASNDGLKQVVAVKRKPHIERQAFLEWWEGELAGFAKNLAGARRLRLCSDREGLVLNSNPASDSGLIAGEGEADGLVEIWAEPEEPLVSLDALANKLMDSAASHGERIERLRLEEHRIV